MAMSSRLIEGVRRLKARKLARSVQSAYSNAPDTHEGHLDRIAQSPESIYPALEYAEWLAANGHEEAADIIGTHVRERQREKAYGLSGVYDPDEVTGFAPEKFFVKSSPNHYNNSSLITLKQAYRNRPGTMTWKARFPIEAADQLVGRMKEKGASVSQEPMLQPSQLSRLSKVIRYSADGPRPTDSDVEPLLRSIHPAAFRANSHAEQTPRLATADKFDELGRHDEANLLRDLSKHIYLEDGEIRDASGIGQKIIRRADSQMIHHPGERIQHRWELSPDERQYLNTALWSSHELDEDGEGQPLDANFTSDDIHPDTLSAMIADWRHFKSENAALIGNDSEGRSRAPHDFWLTRNGHGAGFKDHDNYYDGNSHLLADAAHRYGEYDLYVGDDGMIHGSYSVPPPFNPADEGMGPNDPPYTGGMGGGHYSRIVRVVKRYAAEDTSADPEEVALHRAILANPHELTSAMALADWLDEHGRSGAAAVIREVLSRHEESVGHHRLFWEENGGEHGLKRLGFVPRSEESPDQIGQRQDYDTMVEQGPFVPPEALPAIRRIWGWDDPAWAKASNRGEVTYVNPNGVHISLSMPHLGDPNERRFFLQARFPRNQGVDVIRHLQSEGVPFLGSEIKSTNQFDIVHGDANYHRLMTEESEKERKNPEPPHQLARAIQFAANFHIEIGGKPYSLTKNEQGYGVTSMAEKTDRFHKNYQVFCDEGGNPERCSCPDNVYRGGVCKHMKAVTALKGECGSAEGSREGEKPVQMEAYRAPAGGIAVRGTFYKGGKLIPDMEGPFMNPQEALKKSATVSSGQIVHLSSSKYDPAKLERIRKRMKANFKPAATKDKYIPGQETGDAMVVSYQRAVKFSARDRKSFETAIARDPNESTNRAAYADYLEENHPDMVTPETLNFLRTHQGPAWVKPGPDGKIHAGRKWTMAEIRAADAAAGGHWFERGTMRFFGSRIHGQPSHGPGGVYFISSEQQPSHGYAQHRRMYTVRHFDPNNPDKGASLIRDGSEFQAHGDLVSARQHAQRLAAGLEEPRSARSRYSRDISSSVRRMARMSSNLTSLFRAAREDPYNETIHGAIADAIDEEHPGSPFPEMIRGLYPSLIGSGEDMARRRPMLGNGAQDTDNIWYSPFENSWDGTFPYTAHLGSHGPFELYLGHESQAPEYERGPGAQSNARAEHDAATNNRWIIHAVANPKRGDYVGYTFEIPHERAHEIPQMFQGEANKYIHPGTHGLVQKGKTWVQGAPHGPGYREQEARHFEDAMDRQERERP